MTKKEITDLVMSTFRNVQDVEISDVPGKVDIVVLTDLTDVDALYDLRANIGMLLEPTRPMGVGYDVSLRSFTDQAMISLPARGPSTPTKVYATPEDVKVDFASDGGYGYYDEFGNWTAGYWDLPPYAGAIWIAPRFVSGHFYAGYWNGSRGVFRPEPRRLAPPVYDHGRDRDRDRAFAPAPARPGCGCHRRTSCLPPPAP